MVRCAAVLTYAAFICLTPLSALSQAERGSRRQTNYAEEDSSTHSWGSLSLDKSLNTYHWILSGIYTGTSGPDSIKLIEQFLSTIIRAERRFVTETQSFDLHGTHRISSGFKAAIKLSSFINSDNKNLGISNASAHGFYAGPALGPLAGITIEPLVGFRLDQQLDQSDHGASYILNLASDSRDSSSYGTLLGGFYQYDVLGRRRLETGNGAMSVKTSIFADNRNSLSVQYYRNRRDFYTSSDSVQRSIYNASYNIDSRSDEALILHDTLDYTMGSQALIEFSGSVEAREINHATRYGMSVDQRPFAPNTTTEEFRIGTSARVRYSISDNLRGDFLLSYLERDEKHGVVEEMPLGKGTATMLAEGEGRKNNHARQTALATVINYTSPQNDSVALGGSGTILHYDTPSEKNDDDRDELWYVTNFYVRHCMNRHLQLELWGEANLRHLVYLFSTESSNNSWNRILRLSPRFEYFPFSQLITINSFDVLANYTVYDFENESLLPQSFSFRQFAFFDSTILSLSKRVRLEWYSLIRSYQRGELHWNSFSEKPVNSFEEKSVAFAIQYRMTESLLFSLGIRYFSQLRYGYRESQQTLENIIRNIGPMAHLSMISGSRTEFSVKGSYDRQVQTGQHERGITTVAMLLNIRI